MPVLSVENHGRCGRTRARLVRSAALISMRWAARSKLRSGPTPSNGRRCKSSGQQVSASGATGATPTLNHCQNDCGTLMNSYAATRSTRCASRANVRLWQCALKARMPQARTDTLFCALELSKNTWLLGIQFPDREQPSVYPIKGGDSEGLMAKLRMASDRCAKLSGRKPSIILCYEAGYD